MLGRWYGVEDGFADLAFTGVCKDVAAFVCRLVWEKLYDSCWRDPVPQFVWGSRWRVVRCAPYCCEEDGLLSLLSQDYRCPQEDC